MKTDKVGRVSIGVGVVAALALCGCAGAQAAQFSPQRLADGYPDLQGYWSSHAKTTLERPEGIKDLVVMPEQAKALVEKANETEGDVRDPEDDLDVIKGSQLLEIDGKLRSSLIIAPSDGKLPLTALTRTAQARRAELRRSGFDNPEERPVGERCVGGPGDPPVLYLGDTLPNQIVQTADSVVIGTEALHGGRIIDMGGHPPPDAVRSRNGYSWGRWEGDALVVTTDHLLADDPGGIQSRGGAPVTAGGRIVERFELISADQMLYRFTIEDAALYSVPWLAETILRRGQGPIYEYACHEANYALANILLSARVGRQTALKPPKPN